MSDYRILYNGYDWFVQRRFLHFFWIAEKEPEDLVVSAGTLVNKPILFKTKDAAADYIANKVK